MDDIKRAKRQEIEKAEMLYIHSFIQARLGTVSNILNCDQAGSVHWNVVVFFDLQICTSTCRILCGCKMTKSGFKNTRL